MKGLDFLEPGSCKLTLWWRSLVHSNTDKDLSEKCEDTGGVIETRDDGSFPMWLGQIRAEGDADRG